MKGIILLVEDDPEQRKLLGNIIKYMFKDYEFIGKKDIKSAMEFIKNKKYIDFVISDYNLFGGYVHNLSKDNLKEIREFYEFLYSAKVKGRIGSFKIHTGASGTKHYINEISKLSKRCREYILKNTVGKGFLDMNDLNSLLKRQKEKRKTHIKKQEKEKKPKRKIPKIKIRH